MDIVLAVLLALLFLAPIAVCYLIFYWTTNETLRAMRAHEHQDFVETEEYVSCPRIGGYWQTVYRCQTCGKEYIITLPQPTDSISPI